MNEKLRNASALANRLVAPLLSLILLGPAAFGVPVGGAEKQPYRSPFDLAFAPEGGMLAVSDRTAGRLYLLDTQAGQVAREIELHGKPMGVAWQADGKVVVSEYDAGTVAEIDAKTGKVLRRFSVGPKPVGVAVASKKGLLIVGDSGLHTISIIDLKTGRELLLRRSSPPGPGPLPSG